MLNIFMFIYLLCFVVKDVSRAFICDKIGYNKWLALIPWYSWFAQFKSVNMSGFWVIFSVIPIVNAAYFVIHVRTLFRLYRCFGMTVKQAVFGCILPVIFLPMIAFMDKYQYEAIYDIMDYTD